MKQQSEVNGTVIRKMVREKIKENHEKHHEPNQNEMKSWKEKNHEPKWNPLSKIKFSFKLNSFNLFPIPYLILPREFPCMSRNSNLMTPYLILVMFSFNLTFNVPSIFLI